MITNHDLNTLQPELNRREKAMMRLYIRGIEATDNWEIKTYKEQLTGFMLGVEACCKIDLNRQKHEINTIIDRIAHAKEK